MKLIASLTSPFARKIRIQLAEKGIPFELEEDVPWDEDTHVPDYNPLGKVPVLVADDGSIWYDSPVLASYVEALGHGPALVPAEPMAALVVRQTEALCDGIIEAGAAIMQEGRRPADKQLPPVVARQSGKLERGLDALEQRLIAHQGLGGPALSLGDIAAGCLFGFLDFRMPHLDWRSTRPALAALAQRLASRASFAATVPPPQ